MTRVFAQMVEVQDVDSDVYGFLSMVKEASGQREKGSALLGGDVDYLHEDDVVPSPLHDANFWEFENDEDVDSVGKNLALTSENWDSQRISGDQSAPSDEWGCLNSSNVAAWSLGGSSLTQTAGQKESKENLPAWGDNGVDHESYYSGSKTSPCGWGDCQVGAQGTVWNQRDSAARGANTVDLDQSDTSGWKESQSQVYEIEWNQSQTQNQPKSQIEGKPGWEECEKAAQGTSQSQGDSADWGSSMVDLDQSETIGGKESQSEVYEIEWNQSQTQNQPKSQTENKPERVYNHRGQLNSSNRRVTVSERRQGPPRNRESTQRHLGKFTPDEESILLDIDPVMQKLRKILKFSG